MSTLKKARFSFYHLCVQSELSLVEHGKKSRVRTVSKSTGSQLLKTVLTCDFEPYFTRDNSD